MKFIYIKNGSGLSVVTTTAITIGLNLNHQITMRPTHNVGLTNLVKSDGFDALL